VATIDDILLTVAEPAGAVIAPETVAYALEGTELEGVLVKNTGESGKRPGVLVVHDWYGVSDTTVARATMLARSGYVAFGVDIFGKDVRPTDDGEAAQVAGSYYADPAKMRARAAAGLEQLLADPDVDPSRVAVIGYCFGGSTALELARSGADVAGVVSFHGALVSHDPSDAASITAKLLVLTGAVDPVVPDEAVVAWENELRAAPEVDWQLVSYAGAMHAFTVPGAAAPDHGAQYQERADRRSWRAMQDFFGEIFA
jgi:dienelactone hydrolase